MKTVSKITKSRAGSGSAQPVKLEDFYGLLKKLSLGYHVMLIQKVAFSILNNFCLSIMAFNCLSEL